jgi:MoaA/NifB/PqqE/SkfB family radical SAM enzyme
LCCHSSTPLGNLDTAEINALKVKLLNGEKIQHCQNCYNSESSGSISPRLLESSRWLKDPEVQDYIDNWQVDGDHKIFFYDLRYDNKCNLACISCNPRDSSLWAKELGINTNQPRVDIDLAQIRSAKKVYLAGGEPLINELFIDLIEQISTQDQQPELVINTNLTRTNDRLKKSLTRIKNLTLTVSVDAWGKVNEYHRWPMKWEKFIENLTWASGIGCNIQFNSVVDAVTVLNIHKLQEIEHLCNQWSLSVLYRPYSLLINNLPEEIKQSVHDNFVNIRESKHYYNNLIFKTRVDSIATAILEPGDSTLLSLYIKELDQRRNINHYDYLGTHLT